MDSHQAGVLFMAVFLPIITLILITRCYIEEYEHEQHYNQHH